MLNVAADVVEVAFITDDVIVEGALPEFYAGGIADLVDVFCGKGFVGTNQPA